MCIVLWQIIAIRAQVEELVVDEESLAYLGEIGQMTSLRSRISKISLSSLNDVYYSSLS